MKSSERTALRMARRKKAYLTKRVLLRAAKAGIRKAAEETMQVMGYTVIAQNGWVVKKFADGSIQKIKPLKPLTTRRGLVLD